MFGLGLLGKTHIPHYKNTAHMPAVRMPAPKDVLLPLCQHIGAPATPTVKVGDEVKVGQKIAEASGYVSSPIYSSVSGKVVKIEDLLRSDGRTVGAIRIQSDGEMTPFEGIAPPTVTDVASLVSAVRESGLVGLGGAGFPTAVKLDAIGKGIINTVVINGAECEPYITCDTRTMLDEGDSIVRGIDILAKFLPAAKFIIGIENNKPECIDHLRGLTESRESVSICALPSSYPQGAEKVLIYNTTARVVPEGKLPSDVGVMVINVTSLAVLAKYIDTGMPLVERCVTLDGSAVREPKNIIAPIGTSVRELIEFGGGLKEEAGKILFGGPMMGSAAYSVDEPITKTTGAITVMNRKDAKRSEPTPCIHCGRCVSACPMKLNPTAYSKALNIESTEDRMARLEEYKLNICMECGCCSYVCPANRPLVQNNRIAKAQLREYKAHMATKK